MAVPENADIESPVARRRDPGANPETSTSPGGRLRGHVTSQNATSGQRRRHLWLARGPQRGSFAFVDIDTGHCVENQQEVYCPSIEKSKWKFRSTVDCDY
jgi:hypothetical protein